MGYRAVIEWLALNDDHDPVTPEDVASLVTTTLAADIFRKDPLEVARDILALRAKEAA